MMNTGRKTNMLLLFVAVIATGSMLSSYTRFRNLFSKPSNFPEPVYNFSGNEVTDDGFRLGRRLFYDPVLSADSTISCGSCHIQAAAFTHHGHDLSHGINDLLGTRNSPPIQNLAWYTTFMWDGGIRDLDLQPIAPITNPVEMGDSLHRVLQKLNAHPDYPGLFKKVFGQEKITTDLLMKALSQFMVMLVSAGSKYDKVMRNEGETFTPEESQGYALFRQKCASCHKEPLFTDLSFRNNGLAPNEESDEGRALVSVDQNDRFRFKVPSLRNLKFTFPYMHDGRFYTIDEVLDHYSAGMKFNSTIDPVFILPGNKAGIPLTAPEKEALKKFLSTLNDTSFIRNPSFAEPGAMKYVK